MNPPSDIIRPPLRQTVRAVTTWLLGFAVLHSILASLPVKNAVKRRFGENAFNGFYRFLFNALAVVTFTGVILRLRHLPDRDLYRLGRPWSLLLRAAQAGAFGIALDANIRTGLGRMTGISGVWEWLHGERPIDSNPAQGPQLEGDRAYHTGGSFQWTRHPNNLVPFLIFILNPVMTVRFLTFTALSTLYLVLGSVHEERRLQAVYGKRYDRYRAGKSFYLPWPH